MEMSNAAEFKKSGYLGVNRTGKMIRKVQPQQQHSAFNNPGRQPQPHVYNINKCDFRSIVQQLTGSPSREPSQTPQRPPPPTNKRLQKIRPPPLAPMGFPHHYPHRVMEPVAAPPRLQPSHGVSVLSNVVESPVSAYMRYLQSSITDPSPQLPPSQAQQASSYFPPISPLPAFPSPRIISPSFLNSPTSQFLLSSPSAAFGLPSPRSMYPLHQFHCPPPLSPGFSFSRGGILSPGKQPLLSPGAFFSMPSPVALARSPR